MRADEFMKSFDSDTMLVKSISGKEVKTLNVKDKVKFDDIGDVSRIIVREDSIRPKQNYSKVDPQMKNIYAHKGPDEDGVAQ